MIKSQIETKLNTAFMPTHLNVINESYMHNVPAGSESHFKVIIVSAMFEDQRLIARHRAVNQCLAHELTHTIHALAIHTYTESEWQQQVNTPISPSCRGGSQLS